MNHSHGIGPVLVFGEYKVTAEAYDVDGEFASRDIIWVWKFFLALLHFGVGKFTDFLQIGLNEYNCSNRVFIK
ncbi:MAG: hypothetical protein R6V50_07515 [Thermoplasmatota archaeon]